jgi:hypothetical protein
MVVGLWMMIIGLKGGRLIQNEKKKLLQTPLPKKNFENSKCANCQMLDGSFAQTYNQSHFLAPLVSSFELLFFRRQNACYQLVNSP